VQIARLLSLISHARRCSGLPAEASCLRTDCPAKAEKIARAVGISKKIGWHTFRRTYSSLLAATGDDVKVVQELMRHAKISTTMEVYAQAGMEKKRTAQRRAVDVLLDRKPKNATEDRVTLENTQIVPEKSLKFPEVLL
jgi:integrase